MTNATMEKYGFKHEYYCFDVVPYEIEGADNVERSFKRYGNALNYANKLIANDVWCEINGLYWDSDNNEPGYDQICAC